MNPIESLREECSENNKDAYLYRLRGNSILSWIEDYKYTKYYQDILKECCADSTLRVESGIVMIDPSGHCLSYKFVPIVEAGYTFLDIVVMIRSKIIEFNYKHGVIDITEEETEDLKKIAYLFNKTKFEYLNMEDKKQLIHVKDTADVLNWTLSDGVLLKANVNGWCTLKFRSNNNIEKDYCTILTEDQIKLLEKVNNQINKNKIEE